MQRKLPSAWDAPGLELALPTLGGFSGRGPALAAGPWSLLLDGSPHPSSRDVQHSLPSRGENCFCVKHQPRVLSSLLVLTVVATSVWRKIFRNDRGVAQ